MSKILPARPVILCFVAYYLPGYLSGGPVRTIANFVDHLGDEFDIRIVTSDRDILDAYPYTNIEINAWNMVGKAKVFYASKTKVNLYSIAKLLRDTPHHILYLNSYFSFGFTVLPLIVRRLGLAPRRPCVVAPRGELSLGALALKAFKKKIYIRLAKALGLYQNLHWQASSDLEKAEIIRKLNPIDASVHVAADLTPVITEKFKGETYRTPGSLRLIFLSRISPKKNLDFLLRVLTKVSVIVELAIYGPIEDISYWEQCKILIDKLPGNIHVTIAGEVAQEHVRNVFLKHDVFVFPTRGENFGHVIFESLSVGTPVLVSDQTPWLQGDQGGLKVLQLDEMLWANAISDWAQLDEVSLAVQRSAALLYASAYVEGNFSVQQNRNLFNIVSKSN